MSLKDENAALELELETAKRAIIFEKTTADLTDTQRERVGALVENVEFDTTDEFVTGLKLIVEMEKKKDDEDGKGKGKGKGKDDNDGDEDDEDKALKEQAAAEAAAKAAKTGKLHEMDFNARMSRYKA
jgi:Arc/MetJ-type ribon-helix-helix transcriptional regulator